MARVGDLEHLVENLVGRGLVAPKFVGRQVGQAMIEELSSLGSNLAQSSATRQVERERQVSSVARQAASNPPAVSGARGNNLSKFQALLQKGIPVPLGHYATPSGASSVLSAFPTAKGLDVRNISNVSNPGVNPADQALVQLMLKSSGLDLTQIPQTGIALSGRTFGSLQELIAAITAGGVNPELTNQFLNQNF